MTSTFKEAIGRVKENIIVLSEMVDDSFPGYTRRPFTKWYRQSRAWLTEEMKKCGLEVSIDAASNLVGRREGKNSHLPPIMIGSHTDSVIGGGRYDGVLGVIAGLEIVRQLNEQKIQLNHPLLIVDFTAEESSEFGLGLIGSAGMAGKLSDEDLERRNDDELRLKDALKQAGGRPELIQEEALQKGDVALYLELHIEQGPVLEQEKKDLGIVTGIVGIQDFEVIVEGEANHAGTTPMNMRYDALTAASELVLQIEKIANKSYNEQVVGTVGRLNVEPNGANIVPGRVSFEFEFRSLDDQVFKEMIDQFQQEVERVQEERQVTITTNITSYAQPVLVEEEIIKGIEESCASVGSTIRLPSGAGHDGMRIASVAPIGMIFVPSKDGKSHCPEEWTDDAQVMRGIQALGEALLHFDKNR